MKPFSWKCPYCNQNATIGGRDVHETSSTFTIDNAEGPRELYSFFIVCPNEDCKKYTLSTLLFETKRNTRFEWETGNLIKRFDLIPNSNAKVFPEYVPKAIIEDYQEAVSIPKNRIG